MTGDPHNVVDCAGCGEPTPYEASREDGPPETSYGEFLSTPLGDTYVRTHRRRSCVIAARARLQGKPNNRETVREQTDREARERAAHA